jgi:outer membrane protein insertion porin family
LREKGKQSIGLQGGVSGIAGTFIGLTYQTNNFLGLGETLTMSAQFGDIQRSLMFGFTEPYLFDRPISTGFTIFSSRYSFDQAKQAALLTGQSVSVNPAFVENYNTNSTGFTAFASYPVKRLSFTRVGLTYGLTKTNITTFNDASKLLFTATQFRSVAGPSALNGIVSSTLTPTITYNTIDNPVNSTRGKSFFYSLSFQGGPLGGNVNAITNVFDMKYFHPINKRRNAVGFHVSTAYTTGYGGKDVPPFSRFYMGGESDVRGFDIRSISPVTFIPTQSFQQIVYTDPTFIGPSGPLTRTLNVPVLVFTPTLPGGDLQGFANAEYRIPIVGPVTADLFVDSGTNGILKKNGLKLDPSGLANLNQLFPDAKINSHLQIARGTSFRPRESVGIEFVVQLPIVQAPFRLYYAYNVNRLHSQIISPQDFLEPSLICDPQNGGSACPANVQRGLYPSVLPPDVWKFQVKPALQQLLNNPGRLNYFEPKTKLGFTVSRTF